MPHAERLRRFCSGLACIAATIAVAPSARAQEPVSPGRGPSRPATQASVEVYTFVPLRVSGTLGVADRSVDFSANLGDLADSLQAGGAIRPEFWYGRVGLIVDALYIQLASSRDLPNAVALGVSTRKLSTDLMAGVRVVELPDTARRGNRMTLALGAGVRGDFSNGRLTVADVKLDRNAQTARFVGEGDLLGRVVGDLWLHARADVATPDGVSVAAEGTAEYNFKPATLAFGYRYDHIETTGAVVSIRANQHSLFMSFGLDLGS